MNFNFNFLYSQVFMTLVVLPLPRAVPGKVDSAVCKQNTADQENLSEIVRCLGDSFQFSERESKGRGIEKLSKHLGL